MDKNPNNDIERAQKSLKGGFTMVGKAHIKPWYVLLGWGVLIGVVAAVVYIANPQGRFEPSSALTPPPPPPLPPTSYTLVIAKTPRATVGLGRTLTSKRVDQSFIAPTTLKNLPLQSVKVALTKVGSPAQRITVSIRETRTGPDLALADLLFQPSTMPTPVPILLPDAESTGSAQTASVLNATAIFKSPITLTMGKQYFLVLTASAINFNNFYRVAVDNTNPYSGGNIIAGGLAKPKLDAVATLTFVTTAATCFDSDGGKNYNVKGYVSTNYNGQDINNKVFDSCMTQDPLYPNQLIGVSSCSGPNCQVEDFYCDGSKGPYGSFYSCPNGCKDGACVQFREI